MKFLSLLLLIPLFGIQAMSQSYKCLPSEVVSSDVVSVITATTRSGISVSKETTVSQALKKLNAGCVRGKLVTRAGRSIRFYFLQGCWGNPPADYLEILDRQKIEIKKLKKNFTVIEMTCNRNGIPLQSI